MEIPERYLTPEFWRHLVQITKKLLEKKHFPKRRYDSDIDALIEDVIQDVHTRIIEKPEPASPIVNWPAYFYVFTYYVILEKRDDAFHAHEAGWEKATATVKFEDEDYTVAVETQVADRTDTIDRIVEWPELDVWEIRIVDEKFWSFVDQDLPNVADEQCRECFRRFAELVWKEGISRRKAWERVRPSCHGDRWATFNRWLNKLGLSVMKRWVSGDAKAERGL